VEQVSRGHAEATLPRAAPVRGHLAVGEAHVCLVLGDQVVRVERFADLEAARSFASALAIELGSVGEIEEPFGADVTGCLGPSVILVDIALGMATSLVALFPGDARGAMAQVCAVGVSALMVVDAAMAHAFVTIPARREAARYAIAAFGLEERPGG
jgi:hypothetical protein